MPVSRIPGAARVRVAFAVLVLLVPPARARAQAAAPDPDAGAIAAPAAMREADRPREFFDTWTGPMDAERQRRIWDAVRSAPAEPAATSAVNSWQLVGPIYSVNAGGGNMTGRVRDIDAHNGRVLGSGGGLWRFYFGAIAMSDSVPATWFGSFASPPGDPNTIVLGTGEYNQASGTGVYRTADGGATWTLLSLAGYSINWVSRVRYSPDGSVLLAGTDVGCFRSTDGGTTWSRRLPGNVSDLCIVAGSPNVVFATVYTQGLWKSIDGGVSWAQVTSGGLPAGGMRNGAVSAVLSGPAIVVYVAFDVTTWRSGDGGVTWSNVSPPYTIGDNGMGPAVTACPGNANLVLMANVGLNRSTDGGATWSKIATPNLHADYHVFAWDDNGTGVWAGHDGGWSHSTDSGLTWDTSTNVMPITQFYNVDCERNENGYMIGGAQDNNVLFTPTQALFWSDPALSSTEGDAYGVTLNQYTPSQMWAISGESGGSWAFPHFRTLDGGSSWQERDAGVDANPYSGWVRTDNAYPVRLALGQGLYVYDSADSGATWTRSNPTAFPAPVMNLTSSTRVSPSAVLYACLNSSTQGQRLYVRDGGTWVERSAGLPSGRVWKVQPHPWAAYANEAWAIVNAFPYWRIFHTPDRGLTWTEITGDFPTLTPISDIVIDPYDTNQLVLGTYLGCWATRNGGLNWERWTNGMPPSAKVTEMTTIDLTPSGGAFWVVAATYGRSVWKRDLTGDDPMPSVSVGDAQVPEGNSGTRSITFPVTLSAPSPYTVLAPYATADGSATAADGDYASTTGTVVFAPGQTQNWITVPVNGDTKPETDETFTVSIVNPVRATVGSAGTGTILDDDSFVLADAGAPVTDGTVNAFALSGDTLFVGGSFSHVGPPTGSAVPIDSTTGLPAWLPRVDGNVFAIVPDGSGGWYLGGNFTHVGGQPVANLAHLSADHSVSTGLPAPDGPVFALAVSGGALYVGGSFSQVGLAARGSLAEFDLAGNLQSWTAATDGPVEALAIVGGTLVAGGAFTHVNGQPRARLAALATADGTLAAWNPGANSDVLALLAAGGRLYAGGLFDTLGAAVRHHLGALDPASGAPSAWNPNADFGVYALAFSGGALVAGGTFSSVGGTPRGGLAAIDTATALPTAWAPATDGAVLALAASGGLVVAGGSFTTVAGQPRTNLAAIDAAGNATAWDPEPGGGVEALAAGGGVVFAGGGFATMAASPRANLAAVSASSGAILGWNPGTDGTVSTLAINGRTLFVGGTFATLAGVARARIGAVDAGTGVATSFNPNANAKVWAILPVSATSVVVGGQFTSIGGQARNAIASLATGTGAASTWNPGANGTVAALATDGTLIYVGGAFTSIGGSLRSGLAALTATAVSTWNPAPNAGVTSLAWTGSALFAAGAFTNIGGLARGRAALLSTTKGVAAWNPGADAVVSVVAPTGGSGDVYLGGSFSNVSGSPRQRLASVNLLSTGTLQPWTPEPNGSVNAIAVTGSGIWVGGGFTRIAGLPQAHLSRLITNGTVGVPAAGPAAELAARLAPNPTRGAVRLDFTLPVAARVRIAVYDVLGRRIGAAIEQSLPAGPHAWEWGGGERAAPGLYFVRLEAAGRSLTNRFAVVR